jgi:O-antigen/teichoic acid export membrane protein
LPPPPEETPRASGHFVRSVFSFGVGQGVSWVASAVLVVMLPRYLGDVNLGKLGFALALVALASLISNLGTATYLMKETARDPARAGGLAGGALLTRVPLTAVAAGAVVVFVQVAGYDATTRSVVYVLCGWILIDSVRTLIQGVLQGMQRMKVLAAVPALASTVYTALAVLLLLHGGGPLEVAGAYVAGQLAGLALCLVFLLRGFRPQPSLDRQVWWTLLSGGLPFFVWQAALVVYGQIDSVLLSLLTGDAVVGWYVAAYRIVTVPIFLPSILVTVVFPALAAAAARPQEFNSIARRALHASFLVTLPMSLGIMLLAGPLIHLLRYPEAFQHSIPVILLLAPGFPIVAADMIIGTVLNSVDRQRQWALAGVAAAVLNPLLNLAAIPLSQSHLGNGAIGAAAVTTATEFVLLGAGLYLLPRGIFDLHTLLKIVRSLAAGAVLVAVVLPLRALPLPVPVVAGVAAYLLASLALGAVSTAEIREVVRHLLPRRLPVQKAA